jgi:membrane-bound lytic murein transglycosylase A
MRTKLICFECKCFIILLFLTGCLLFACTSVVKKEPPTVVKHKHVEKRLPMTLLSPEKYPDFSDDMFLDGLEFAIHQSLQYLMRLSPQHRFTFGNDIVNAAQMKKSLTVFKDFLQKNPRAENINEFILKNYTVYASSGSEKNGKVLFTGYYEPYIEGSLQSSPTFTVPIYSIPSDLISVDLSPFSKELNGKKILARWNGKTVVPYHERTEIDFGDVLNGKAKPLVWVKDIVDAFFLHIQGSGKVYLKNGSSIHLHYHAVNGRPYRSIGKYLIEKGKIPRDEMSMQKIRQYLASHPEEIKTILGYNPSYVFFRVEEQGPVGAINVLLTPGRSIATDRRIFPLSALAFIESHKPYISGNGNIKKWASFSRFVLNQDTGGAIRGPGRADLFWGSGEYARLAAGHMQHPGNLYFLILKKNTPVIRLSSRSR